MGISRQSVVRQEVHTRTIIRAAQLVFLDLIRSQNSNALDSSGPELLLRLNEQCEHLQKYKCTTILTGGIVFTFYKIKNARTRCPGLPVNHGTHLKIKFKL
jgi:hypothetical protein